MRTVTMPMQSARPIEIEPLSNRFLIHPLAAALLPRAISAGLHPNTITIAGLVFGLLAGAAYTRWADWHFAALGFALMIAWHVMDGLDGKLARATGKTSAIGRFLDGVADYATFVAVNLALALTHPDTGLALALAVASGVAHALQSQFYEGERATYIRRLNGDFVPVARTAAGGAAERLYNSLEARLGNRTRPFDARLAAAGPDARAALIAAWQPRAAAILRWMAPLSANGRTLAIFIAALLQQPILYWLWELVVLTLLALAAAHRLRQAEDTTIVNA